MPQHVPTIIATARRTITCSPPLGLSLCWISISTVAQFDVPKSLTAARNIFQMALAGNVHECKMSKRRAYVRTPEDKAVCSNVGQARRIDELAGQSVVPPKLPRRGLLQKLIADIVHAIARRHHLALLTKKQATSKISTCTTANEGLRPATRLFAS